MRRRRERIVTDAATSRRMADVRQKDTTPELAVRQALTMLGLRYRVRNRDLPGSPDIANRSRRWAVFVHGCFWHRHPGCVRTTTPKRNRVFWIRKFEANVARDARAVAELQKRGFRVITIWECETEVDLHHLVVLIQRRFGEGIRKTDEKSPVAGK